MRTAPFLTGVVVLLALGGILAGCAEGPDPVVTGRAPEGPDATAPSTSDTPDLASLDVEFDPVVGGFDQPLLVLGAADGSGRLFVAEKSGALRVVRDGVVDPEPFLDLSQYVSTESERGLLGVAFPEGFAEHGRFYVSYSATDGASIISRFIAEGDRAVRESEAVLLRVPQPYANHNGGHIAFGPDGYLYVGLGDGGSAGDPLGSGQDPVTLLGSILRLDVGESPDSSIAPRGADYAIPDDNPFFDGNGGAPEVWTYGLRNPWRFSFDRETGDLWIGDVGQNAVEEVDFQPAGSPGGQNWGWNLFEGTAPYPEDRTVGENQNDFAWPIVEYRHPTGQSVTGGYVYRGPGYPQMRGVYLYGDFVSGRIWGLARDADGSAENRELAATDMQVVSFGEDDEGELYVVDFAGTVYRVRAK